MGERTCDRQGGFSLVEILVTLVIVLIGLLGLAGVQMRAHQAEMESYQRAQALILASDMADRINTNRKAPQCYAITTNADGTPYVGTNAAPPTCSLGLYSGALRAIADADLAAWDDLLEGASENVAGVGNVGAMVGARGCITRNAATETYRVSVAWQGIAPTVSPTVADANATCGLNLYNSDGTDNLRREVSVSVRIANLK